MLNFKVTSTAGKKKDGVSFIPVFKEDASRFRGIGKEALAVFRESRFKGDKLESISINIPEEHVVVIGLGKRSEVTGELLRRYGTLCYAAGETMKKRSAYVSTDIKCRIPAKDAVRCVSEGLILSSYRFDKYITEKDKKKRELRDIFVVSSYPGAAGTLHETVTICRGTFMVRDLVNENAKDKTPEKIEKLARSIAKGPKMKFTVIDEKQMKKLGMELILAVNSGSSYPPRLVIIEYMGNPGSGDRIVLVGKGITFDSGGINLKPTGYVEDMRSDMGGAAVALAALKTAADLKMKRNIIAVMPLTENAIGSKSYKPGDIYSSYSGKTVEIKNTDAEGRLVLADAISYASKKLKPKVLIDLATLTGAMQYTFGPYVAGVLCNDKGLTQKLFKAGQETHERIWELPLYEEYEEAMKGETSDIANTSNMKYAGGITAAGFLKNFLGKGIRWAHIDIAGTAFSEKKFHYIPKGGTGFGVRLLIDYLKK